METRVDRKTPEKVLEGEKDDKLRRSRNGSSGKEKEGKEKEGKDGKEGGKDGKEPKFTVVLSEPPEKKSEGEHAYNEWDHGSSRCCDPVPFISFAAFSLPSSPLLLPSSFIISILFFSL